MFFSPMIDKRSARMKKTSGVDPVARAVELLSNEAHRWGRDARQTTDVLTSATLPGLEIPLTRVF